ncbi:esterase [Fusarium heterosporum]|uniref:Esterase n=1 Tax=Fusarium heterosporum TaxID=42747 RepID=A0A8H5WGX4_FUSHE|nr:esterase [Fusarium heterosporum]
MSSVLEDDLGGFAGSPWGLTNTPVTYDPPVNDPSELKSKSVGNETLAHREASVHIAYDHCVIDFLKQAGGKPEWIKLANRGIKGNSHFLHVEKNNLQIAGLADAWIQSKTPQGPKGTFQGIDIYFGVSWLVVHSLSCGDS